MKEMASTGRGRCIEMKMGKNQKGFTLIELLAAISLSIIVLGAVQSVYRVQTHTVKAQEAKMEALEYARAALDLMVREVRNSGFFPTGTACSSPANTTGIVAASTTGFQLVYDANGDGNCTGTLATTGWDENIAYAYTGSDITRAVNGGTAQVLTAGNVTAFSFSYLDVNGVATANVASIKRVVITLSVQSLSTDTQFGGLQTISMNSNVDLRNR
jgi:prepilin-type N-terminal cleavage/methylation domain-containing protein